MAEYITVKELIEAQKKGANLSPYDLERITEFNTAIQQVRKETAQEILKDIRDMWAWEQSNGHPSMALRLEDWAKYCIKQGAAEDWWELKQGF
jgi:hypothetical protein